eukprot:TRINITY_DN76866_c0_g1_i1.p1 TRINITY_DN76866_c0_g1~~TRINITY_DN76866_c0_g1_i1.p1  ORF type:complete len:717 (+),score=148.80 TRINITY_DN76866_c0_g1_i1:89-2239(+)
MPPLPVRPPPPPDDVHSLSREVDALARDLSLRSKPGKQSSFSNGSSRLPGSRNPSGDLQPFDETTCVVEHLQSELQALLGQVSEQARRIAEESMEARKESHELRQKVENFISLSCMPELPNMQTLKVLQQEDGCVFESIDEENDAVPEPVLPGQAGPTQRAPSQEAQKGHSFSSSASTPFTVVPQQQAQALSVPSEAAMKERGRSSSGTRTEVMESRRMLMQWKQDLESQNRQVAKEMHLRAERAEKVAHLSVPLPATDLDDETTSHTSLFAGAEAVKDEIRKALYKKEYNVVNLYKHEGICQRIARHQMFEMFTLALIGANCIWIAVETDQNRADFLFSADWGFQVGENLFCTLFTLELCIRFGAFRRKCDALRDSWFVFDCVLVLLMIVETWGMYLILACTGSVESFLGNASFLRVVRVLRLLRTARMAKLMRAMPELMLLVKGMAVACRSVLFTLLLLMIFVYVFAIICMQLSRDTPLEGRYFPRFHEAMFNLLFEAVLPDLNIFMQNIVDESWLFGFVMMAFILLGHITVMNMLVGVLVEVIKTVSEVEREQLEVGTVKRTFHDMITKMNLDEDGDSRISRDEFVGLLTKPEAAKALMHIGVDAVALLDYQDHLFGRDGDDVLTFGEFMEAILELRGSNMAKVKDIVDLRKFVSNEVSCLHELLLEPCAPVKAGSFRRTSLSSHGSIRGARSSRRSLTAVKNTVQASPASLA